MRKTNFTHERKNTFSRWYNLILISALALMGLQEAQAQPCALACNGNTQVSLDENCEAEITPAMILNADTTICPNGDFEVIVSYHGIPIPTSPVVTCDYINTTLQVMVRDMNSGNSCWGDIYVEDKLAPRIECGNDTLFCYQMPKYTGPKITDNCTKAAFLTDTDFDDQIQTLNEVFGGGNWDRFTFGGVDPDELLSCKYDVIWVDGFSFNGNAFKDFFDNNRNAIELWVEDGGSLFANASPQSAFNLTIDVGFGVQIIEGPNSQEAYAVDEDHPIFEGPYCPVVKEYGISVFPSGTAWSLVCPPGMNVILEGEPEGSGGPIILMEGHFGSGNVVFGSLNPFTTDWVPSEEAGNMFNNILQYLRDISPRKVEMTLLDERIFPYNCNREFVKRVERDYIATDRSGNQSRVCTQQLYLKRFPLEEVDCPKEWSIAQDCPIACENIETGVIPTLPNGAPVPEYTGVPTIDGIALWPPQDFYCNISVTYDDIVLPKVGCVQKIMRMWTIEEWWCNTDEDIECPQLLEIVDTLPPSIINPGDIETTTKGGYVCEADVYLPAVDAEDICNNNLRVDVRYPGGFLKEQNGGLVHLPVGVHTVTYLVYDGCYNVDSTKITVTVEDLTPPVAVCDRYTVVGLTYDSVAHVYAETFDDGTYDDCYIDSFAVRRMDEGAGCGVFQPNFKSYVEFCCEDIGENVMVIFRAYDKSGNYNDCMVEVEVQDKILPHIYCPPNITVSCDFHYDPNNLSASFGKVVTDKSLRDPIVLNDPYADWDSELIDGHAYDNCTVSVATDSVFDISQCNVGTITRTFTATDPNGSVSCTQTITIENFEPFDGRTDIIWPAEFDTIGCVDPDLLTEDITGKPRFIEDDCDLVGYSFEDHVFPFNNTSGSGGACLKIIRKWKVIDWCDFDYDIRSGRLEYEKYEYEQIIKVNDDVDPEFTFVTPDSMFCSFDTTCTAGPATLIATADDSCTPDDDLRWEFKIDAFNDGIYDTTATGNGATIDASGDYPLGDHRIKYVFEDRCGNKITTERLFSVVNCKAPTPYCKNGVVVDLMPMDTNRDGTVDIGMIEIWASDLDLGSFGPCGNPVVLSFSSDTTDTNRMFDCDSVGQRNVEIWVTDRITGNQSFCRTFVIIQDNTGACGNTLNGGSVSGFIFTEDQKKVRDAQVDLFGSGFGGVMTQNTGQYAFPNMPFGGAYEVAPAKDDEHMNGISTRDLIFIQRHLLGKEDLGTPYKMIAADVDGNADITVADIVELRRLILGAYSELPSNTSWKFVDKGYKFPDPQDPFNPMYPEKYVIDHFVSDMPNVDFVAVKVGDVDNSVEEGGLNGNTTRSGNSMILTAEAKSFDLGEEIAVEFSSNNFIDIAGYQFTLNFDPEMLEFASVESGVLELSESNVGLNYLEEGMINMSWNTVNGLNADKDEVLFTITFTGVKAGELGSALSLNSRMVSAEAYTGLDEIIPVRLGFNGSNGESANFRLYQNHPNPFNRSTVIGFDLPEDSEVQLTVYDVTGKVVALYELAGNKGYNSAEIFASELTSTGVLYYQLDSKGYTATKKMVVLQ